MDPGVSLPKKLVLVSGGLLLKRPEKKRGKLFDSRTEVLSGFAQHTLAVGP